VAALASAGAYRRAVAQGYMAAGRPRRLTSRRIEGIAAPVDLVVVEQA
jgi:hypothetical protein